ncbi:MAG: hypothetical protein ACJ75B_19805 [Flavisolibacter sp.]
MNRSLHIIFLRTCASLCLFLMATIAFAQYGQAYSVKNGKMYIQWMRSMRESALDSFVTQFQLFDLGLKRFVHSNNPDSLLKQGWKIEVNNEVGFVISKPLLSSYDLVHPADKILFTEKEHLGERFPAVNNGILFGVNHFKNKFPFRVEDSVVYFFLRNHLNASRVMLAGSFNRWEPADLRMTRTDSGWIAAVKLGPGKYWYKFIADGQWMVDADNKLSENDGLGNINSVYFRPNFVFQLRGFQESSSVNLAGSFNNWNSHNLPMQKTESGWVLPLYLAEGTHRYVFIIDGQKHLDEANPQKFPDGAGGYNSVVRIGKPWMFRLKGFEQAKEVMLTGSFNGWRENELFLNKTSDGWELPYVLGPGNYEYRYTVDGKPMADPARPSSQTNSTSSFLVIAPNYTFRLKGFEGARSVYLAGDFNGWKPQTLAMKKEGDSWTYNVHLSAGKHLYKFIVDGKWIIDPANNLWEQNEYGTGNSVLWVGD